MISQGITQQVPTTVVSIIIKLYLHPGLVIKKCIISRLQHAIFIYTEDTKQRTYF